MRKTRLSHRMDSKVLFVPNAAYCCYYSSYVRDDSNREQEEFDSFLCRENLNLHSSGASLENYPLVRCIDSEYSTIVLSIE